VRTLAGYGQQVAGPPAGAQWTSAPCISRATVRTSVNVRRAASSSPQRCCSKACVSMTLETLRPPVLRNQLERSPVVIAGLFRGQSGRSIARGTQDVLQGDRQVSVLRHLRWQDADCQHRCTLQCAYDRSLPLAPRVIFKHRTAQRGSG
jgi:hypothetical protein